MTIDINVTLFVREQRVITSSQSAIDTNVVTLSVQERAVAWVRGDIDTNVTLFVPLGDIAYPQSPLDVPKSLPNPIPPIMDMIQFQINRTLVRLHTNICATYRYILGITMMDMI